MTRRRAATTAPARCAGSVLVQAALALSMLVGVLVGTELGWLFYLKREMQKAVDLAAMAGAQALATTDCAGARAVAVANGALNLPAGLPLTTADVECGRWDPATYAAPTYYGTPATGQAPNAVKVVMRRTPSLLMPNLPGAQARTIAVQALATRRQPRAALTIRSTLASVDAAQAPLLNAVLGGMLGGSLALDAVAYNGLATGRLKLLGYLDQLALSMGVAAGDYDRVLDTAVPVGTLLQGAVTALTRQGDTAQATVTALDAFRLAANAPAAQPLVKLGSLIKVQSGTPAAALMVDLQVLQLAEALVQLANGRNGLVASVPLGVPGLLNLTASARVIEPPQLSAIGDPALAKRDPTGANAIAVRTAQVRTLITVELPLLTGITALTNALSSALAPLLSTLNSVLKLDLGNVLACAVVCTNQWVVDAAFLAPVARIDINLDAGGGTSRVTDFACANPAATSLTARTTTTAAALRIGTFGGTVAQAKAQVFGAATAPVVAPLPLLDVGAARCTKLLAGVLKTCEARVPFYGGGLGLKADLAFGATTADQTFANPPDVRGDPAWLAISTVSVTAAIGQTLRMPATLLQPIAPTAPSTTGANSSSTVLQNVASALAGVTTALATVVSNVLSPLVDPLIATVVRDLLGLDLAKTEVGGRLGCADGEELVF
ncbi:MAG TPA: TadG family pilus assembly protein [Variovorax sp.]|nr:TadG family pilus assembly protein [Variovorax sp.]